MSPTQIGDTLRPEAAEAIVTGCHADPFGVLGMHGGGDRPLVRAGLRPARRGGHARRHGPHRGGAHGACPSGRAVCCRRGGEPFAYRLRLVAGKHAWIEDDPYRFGLVLGEMDVYLLAEGRHRRVWEKLGAHPVTMDGVEGVSFAVWAPNARRVSVVGDFNAWDGRRNPMRRRTEAGVWELFIPGLARGLFYKFEILDREGQRLPLKTDPLAFTTELPPDTSSVIHGVPQHDWQDSAWMAARGPLHGTRAPVSIYEVHLGSWQRADGNQLLDYDELADRLIPYVKDMGFTHVELLPVSEHPFSGSWGYQPISLYAPTRRFGAPEGFQRFVERAHRDGIGVIVDWVPAHFPTDEHGLARFDGTHLYEYADPREGFHRDWNTLIYNFGRTEVANFLWANAMFWLETYHVDGLRVDAVASMLYRDYSRDPGEWVPNAEGGRENLEAIAFLRALNERVDADGDGAVTAAEESTAFPLVSGPVSEGGLGFDFKWNMGWMHDTLNYIQQDPLHRRHHHDSITFGLHYAFSENFILPLSHDEVVHGKGSLIAKMPGDRWRQFANLRAYFAFMWTHPGKKLLFMGGEFAQGREWNHDASLDWHLLDDPMHRGVQTLVRDLNELYRAEAALHEQDCSPAGFSWIDASDVDASVFVYARWSVDGRPVVVVANFTPVTRPGYRIGLPRPGAWREALNTDASPYGGSDTGNAGAIVAEAHPWHGHPQSAELVLPPLGALVLAPA